MWKGNRAGGGGGLKSRQRGISSIVNVNEITIPISTVDSTKSVVRVQPYGWGGTSGEPEEFLVVGEFSDDSNVKFSLPYGNDTTRTANFEWEVLEFDGVKSMQSGFTGFADGNTITVSQVDENKSMLFYSFTTNNTTASIVFFANALYLLDSTTIKYENLATTAVNAFQWFLVEFE